jgi:hypothetical protein
MSDGCGKYTCSGSNTGSCWTWNSVELLWLCRSDALSLYTGSTDEAPEIIAEERTEFGVTSELDAPVEGSIVDVERTDISATLESHSEPSWLSLSCPRDLPVAAIECSCEAAQDEGLLSAYSAWTWKSDWVCSASIDTGFLRTVSSRQLRLATGSIDGLRLLSH